MLRARTRDILGSQAHHRRVVSIGHPEDYPWWVLSIYDHQEQSDPLQKVRFREEVFRLAAQWLLQGLIEEKE